MNTHLKKNVDVILISLTISILSACGKLFANRGSEWYTTLTLPNITLPHWVFSIVWTLLYLLTALAVIIVVRSYKHTTYYYLILRLFWMAALLNLAWSYLFFVHHSISGALLDYIVLEFVLITIFALTWSDARVVALLLLPSIVWTIFALVLNYKIFLLN